MPATDGCVVSVVSATAGDHPTQRPGTVSRSAQTRMSMPVIVMSDSAQHSDHSDCVCDSENENTDGDPDDEGPIFKPASLHEAVLSCDETAVRRLLDQGADPDEPDWAVTGNPPILVAAATGCVPIVRALIEAGCDVDARSARGETALHLALSGRQLSRDLVVTLLDAGCDATIHENLRHQTPLHQIIRHLSSAASASSSPFPSLQCTFLNDALLETFQRLAKCGNVNALDHRSRTPLHRLAASNCDHIQAFHILFKHGADLNIRNDRGETALHEALERDRASSIVIALASETDLYCRSNYHESALHVAARKNRPDLVAYLLTRDVPVNGQDLRGNTALHLASGKGYKEVVGHLIQCQNVELNAPNKEGLTPLHFAVESGFIDVVEMLLKAEACDVTAKTKMRQTPLDLAQQDYRRRSQPEMSLVLTRELARRHSSSRFS